MEGDYNCSAVIIESKLNNYDQIDCKSTDFSSIEIIKIYSL